MGPDAFATGFLLAILIAALVRLTRAPRAAHDRLERSGVCTEAEVLDVWQDGSGSYCVRYRFTPNGGGRPVTRNEYAGCLRAALPDVGQTVTVRYDPVAPQRARLEFPAC